MRPRYFIQRQQNAQLFIRTLLSYNIVVSRACAATHKKLKFRLYTMFLKSETSLEFNQLHVFEPYIFFDFVKQLCVVFWMIFPSNSQNSSLLVVS